MIWPNPRCEERYPTCKISVFFAEGSENTLLILLTVSLSAVTRLSHSYSQFVKLGASRGYVCGCAHLESW